MNSSWSTFAASLPASASALAASRALNEHKERLMVALGPQRQPIYLANLKHWFRQQWTKERFDRESRKLLNSGYPPGALMCLHNQFFVALLNKVDPQQLHDNPVIVRTTAAPNIKLESLTAPLLEPKLEPKLEHGAEITASDVKKQDAVFVAPLVRTPAPAPTHEQIHLPSSASPSAKRRKRSIRPPSMTIALALPSSSAPTVVHPRHNFDMVDLFDYSANGCQVAGSETSRISSSGNVLDSSGISSTNSSSSSTRPLTPPRYAAHELFLPDAGLITGRLLVGAWQLDLAAGADDACADIIVQSVHLLLKNIVQAVLMQRKQARTSGAGGQYMYDIGRQVADPSVRSNALRRPRPVDDEPLEVDLTLGVPPAPLPPVYCAVSGFMVQPPPVDQTQLFAAGCDWLQERRPRRRVNVLDVWTALGAVERGRLGLVPAQSVLAPALERMTQMLH